MIDLGKWASGEYKVSSPVMDPDLLEELENMPSSETKYWKN